MKTVTMLQQLQRDMYEQFKEYFGHDYTHEMQLKHKLDKLSDRLTVVYTKMMNEINQKAQSPHSNFSIKEVPMPVMDAILRDEYMKKDHSGLRVLLTQLNTLPGGGGNSKSSNRTKHLNRPSTRNTKKSKRTYRHAQPEPDYDIRDDDEWDAYPEPDDDIRFYDDPDDDFVNEHTKNISGHQLELMIPTIKSAIEMLKKYDYSMFPSIKRLVSTEPALAKSMGAYMRERCQAGLECLDRHDYNRARFHLQHVIRDIEYIHYPSIEKSDLESPAARRRR